MTLFKQPKRRTFKALPIIDNPIIEKEIAQLRKMLAELRIQSFLGEAKEIHLIARTKKKIAQLSFEKNNNLKAKVDLPIFIQS